MGAVNGTHHGSRLAEPEEYWDLGAAMLDHSRKNVSANICLPKGFNSVSSFGGIFLGRDPLNHAGPLTVLQIFLASSVILLTSRLLKPIGQPLMVAQILGGIILCSSILGVGFARKFFPLVSFVMLDLIANLGIMFYNFLIGVQTDPMVLKLVSWKSFAIAISASTFSVALPFFGYYLISDYLTEELKKNIPVICKAQVTFTFPTITRYLYELDILNSEFGHVAVASSIIGGHISLFYLKYSLNEVRTNWIEAIVACVPALLFILVIVFVFRPATLWMINLGNDWEALKKISICSVFVAVLVTGLISDFLGLNVIFGPFIFGVVLPTGPPIGSEIVNRLEFIISWILMPIYHVKAGLGINFNPDVLQHAPWVGLIIFLGFVGKILGAVIASFFCRIPLIDAVFLGLVIHVKGVIELALFKSMRRSQLFSHTAYVIMYVSSLAITCVVTGLIRVYYNPKRSYLIYNMRTIMDSSKPNVELRLLLCMRREESVPSIINILEASNHTEDNPIAAFIVNLVELRGRATPLFINHNSSNLIPEAILYENIANALKNYQLNHKSTISVHPFTAITPIANMHDDICLLALEKRTSLIIIPFHMNLEAIHVTGSSSITRGSRNMSMKVLDNSPCSVAILIERSLRKKYWCAYANWSPFRVAVLFLGRLDDREALAYGARMSGHPKIDLTVIRLIVSDDHESAAAIGEKREAKLDNNAVFEFNLSMQDNERVTYIEEVIIDGSGTLRVIQSLGNDYDLIMVGRRHKRHSPLIAGLTEWNEYTELGTIGDILASSDFQGDSMILVLQQHDSVEQQYKIGN